MGISFSFPELLPIEVYRELQTRLVNSFEKADIKATFDIRAETIDFSDDLLQDYYQQAFVNPCVIVQVLRVLFHN